MWKRVTLDGALYKHFGSEGLECGAWGRPGLDTQCHLTAPGFTSETGSITGLELQEDPV